MTTLMQKAEQLEAEGVFIGGRRKHFETAGRKLLMTLLSQGLTPGSSVLDIGCGCLRGGYWLIHFLDRGGYCGIEPNAGMLDAGIRVLLEPGLLESRQPQFDHNADFDFQVFGRKFDYYVARSIWTHTSKQQIQTMLDGFVRTAHDGATFMASYKRPTLLRRDYRGKEWVGLSHESSTAGAVRHSLSWIRGECAARGLVVAELRDGTLNFGSQTWLRITQQAGRH